MQIYKYANIQIYEHNDACKEILVIYDHKVHLLVTNTATYLNSWMVSFIEFPIADSATWPLLKGCQALGRGSDREEICIDYETYFDLITKCICWKDARCYAEAHPESQNGRGETFWPSLLLWVLCRPSKTLLSLPCICMPCLSYLEAFLSPPNWTACRNGWLESVYEGVEKVSKLF